MTAHNLPDVTVVADAGMASDANQKAIENAGLSFILGARVPGVPYPVAQWRREHPGEQIGDGQVFTLRWPALADSGRRDQPVTTSSGACKGSTEAVARRIAEGKTKTDDYSGSLKYQR